MKMAIINLRGQTMEHNKKGHIVSGELIKWIIYLALLGAAGIGIWVI